MKKDVAISVQNVTMSFNLNKEKVDNLKEYFIKLVTRKLEYKKYQALKNISFEVKKGDRLAIMGFNGAGKSTLLKVIVGVYKPTTGKVERDGVIAPLLELGAGFDPNYSGKENIYLYGSILGYSREYIDSKYREIVRFSELGRFINVPLKNYSSGMRARLGFSIATAVEPDILILDEVLSVGDAKFREKSMKKVQSMFDKGVTVLFVSHNASQVKALCNRAILINHGEIIAQGDVNDVANLYQRISKGDKDDRSFVAKEVAAFKAKQKKAEAEKVEKADPAPKPEVAKKAPSAPAQTAKKAPIAPPEAAKKAPSVPKEAAKKAPVTPIEVAKKPQSIPMEAEKKATASVDTNASIEAKIEEILNEIRNNKPKKEEITNFEDVFSSSHRTDRWMW